MKTKADNNSAFVDKTKTKNILAFSLEILFVAL